MFESKVEGNCIYQSRIINNSKEEVFNAWINPHLLEKWFGPSGFTLTSTEVNIQPAGYWRFIFHGPDGTDYPNVIQFIEIEKPDLLIYIHTDDNGVKSPHHFKTEVRFTKLDQGTKVEMTLIFDSVDDAQYVIQHFNALEGGKETLERLDKAINNII